MHSWLDTFWPRRYLGRRDRIALNANFFFLFKEAPGDHGQGQFERAAGLIASALDYKLRLDGEEIPPIIQRGQTLSMEQNKFLFSETRIPGSVQDTVRAPYTDEWPGPSRPATSWCSSVGECSGWRCWVRTAHRTQWTKSPTVCGRCSKLCGAGRPGTSVGHLTTKARARWAVSRELLRDHTRQRFRA